LVQRERKISRRLTQKRISENQREKNEESFQQIAQIDAERNQRRLTQKGISEISEISEREKRRKFPADSAD